MGGPVRGPGIDEYNRQQRERSKKEMPFVAGDRTGQTVDGGLEAVDVPREFNTELETKEQRMDREERGRKRGKLSTILTSPQGLQDGGMSVSRRTLLGF